MTDPQVPPVVVNNNAPAPDPKPGIKTTEFWLGMVVVVFSAVSVVYAQPWAKVAGLVAMGLAAAGYSLSRGQAKGN